MSTKMILGIILIVIVVGIGAFVFINNKQINSNVMDIEMNVFGPIPVNIGQSVDDIAAEESLLRNMTEFLSYSIPHFERDIPKNDRDIMIKHSIKVARSYGFKTEQDIAVFIAHMMTINPGFHNQPRIHAILTNPTIPIKERLDHIVSDPTEQDLEQASKMVDATVYWARVLQEAGETLSQGESTGISPTGQSFYSKVAQENSISFDEVLFIEASFKKHGKDQGAAFGDLTGGLEPIAKGNQLKIKKTESTFEVEIVGDTWDLNISIDSRTGDWLSATTGDLVPDPA